MIRSNLGGPHRPFQSRRNRRKKRTRRTHLGIELVDSTDGLFDTTVFDRLADLHALLDHRMVDVVRETSLAGELDRSVGEPLDQEVIKDQSVEIAVTTSAPTTPLGEQVVTGRNKLDQRCKVKEGCPQVV
jgi:hypothetical protein